MLLGLYEEVRTVARRGGDCLNHDFCDSFDLYDFLGLKEENWGRGFFSVLFGDLKKIDSKMVMSARGAPPLSEL